MFHQKFRQIFAKFCLFQNFTKFTMLAWKQNVCVNQVINIIKGPAQTMCKSSYWFLFFLNLRDFVNFNHVLTYF